jgi:glycerophosphoryl diester phosphodiesterase
VTGHRPLPVSSIWVFLAWFGLVATGTACPVGEAAGDDDSGVAADDDDTTQLEPVDLPTCLDDTTCPYLFACGHRGAILFAPENTLVGFDVALEFGVDIVEVDARPTADQVLVVMHDSTVDRTTDGSGAVDQLTLDQIRELAVVSEFDGIPDQPVPTFVEALEHLRGRALVNVDAKTGRFDLIVADILSADASAWVYIQVDDLDEGLEVRELDGSLRLMPDIEQPGDVELYGDALQPELAEVPWNQDDEALFAGLADRGIRVNQNALGVADAAAMAHEANGDDPCTAFRGIWERGATLIQTDAPHLLVPCLTALNTAAGYEHEPG